MTWVDVFAVLVVCHLAGDFLLQTSWQALHKQGGLGRDRESRRALFTHVLGYALPFVPALVWIADQNGAARAIAAIAAILSTHLVLDDGRALVAYARTVKHTEVPAGSPLWMGIDQSMHVVVLFAAAVIAAG
jgi:hypothetical protein